MVLYCVRACRNEVLRNLHLSYGGGSSLGKTNL